jgi:hypothetical protein
MRLRIACRFITFEYSFVRGFDMNGNNCVQKFSKQASRFRRDYAYRKLVYTNVNIKLRYCQRAVTRAVMTVCDAYLENGSIPAPHRVREQPDEKCEKHFMNIYAV